MIRLNPQQWLDKAVTCNLFPPEDDYFTQLFATNYREFLETNVTTDEGIQYVARHYGVEAQWKSYLDGSSQDNCVKDYHKLLHIIKTLSNQDFVWISFVEGLHRHAAIIMCLACSQFDLENNNIDHDSLKKKDFKLAGVPHYKNPQMFPIQVLNAILNGNFDAPMLMNPSLVQVLLPAHTKLQIDALMNTLKESSMWISTNKNFQLRNLSRNGLQMDLQRLWNSLHPYKETSTGQYLRTDLSIRMMWKK
jgi:hypothetical protein